MRNPCNSIQVQVQEQQTLNKNLRDFHDNIDNMCVTNCKKKIEGILVRQEQSTNVQLSSVRILNFLLNDMLDYAQLSSGQFRKFINKFNLVDSVTEIMNVMSYKAQELRVNMNMKFVNF